ncbi:MAG: hypothetical protein R3296_14330 [Oleiphilaceae bacterium]|nr:hypothetical protein [Oleiphilaceae bacterium]
MQLAYVRPVADRGEALRLEWRIKQLSKRRKEDLVAGRLSLSQLEPSMEEGPPGPGVSPLTESP